MCVCVCARTRQQHPAARVLLQQGGVRGIAHTGARRMQLQCRGWVGPQGGIAWGAAAAPAPWSRRYRQPQRRRWPPARVHSMWWCRASLERPNAAPPLVRPLLKRGPSAQVLRPTPPQPPKDAPPPPPPPRPPARVQAPPPPPPQYRSSAQPSPGGGGGGGGDAKGGDGALPQPLQHDNTPAAAASAVEDKPASVAVLQDAPHHPLQGAGSESNGTVGGGDARVVVEQQLGDHHAPTSHDAGVVQAATREGEPLKAASFAGKLPRPHRPNPAAAPRVILPQTPPPQKSVELETAEPLTPPATSSEDSMQQTSVREVVEQHVSETERGRHGSMGLPPALPTKLTGGHADLQKPRIVPRSPALHPPSTSPSTSHPQQPSQEVAKTMPQGTVQTTPGEHGQTGATDVSRSFSPIDAPPGRALEGVGTGGGSFGVRPKEGLTNFLEDIPSTSTRPVASGGSGVTLPRPTVGPALARPTLRPPVLPKPIGSKQGPLLTKPQFPAPPKVFISRNLGVADPAL